MNNDMLILNASCGTGKRSHTVHDVLDFTGTDTTILVIMFEDGKKPTFISGSGVGYSEEVGQYKRFRIQGSTNDRFKNGKIINVIQCNADGYTTSLNNEGLNKKCALYVMK